MQIFLRLFIFLRTNHREKYAHVVPVRGIWVNLSSESSQPTQERQRGVKALLATEGTLVPQRSLKLAWIMPSEKEESEA